MHALRAPVRNTLSRPPIAARRGVNPARASASSFQATTTAALALVPPPPSTAAALSLLEAIAPLDRGALATSRDAERVDSLARELERLAPATRQPAMTALRGKWRLLYISSPAVFRQSPFFDAFAAAVGNREAAEAIFRFTNELPMARVGNAWQRVELGDGGESGGANATTKGRLISEVALAVGELPYFPGLTGIVESSANIDAVTSEGDDYVLSMTMAQTRVTNSLFSGLGGDGVVAPVERAFETLRGPGAARVVYRVTALADASAGGAMLRVTRAEGTGLLMVHARE